MTFKVHYEADTYTIEPTAHDTLTAAMAAAGHPDLGDWSACGGVLVTDPAQDPRSREGVKTALFRWIIEGPDVLGEYVTLMAYEAMPPLTIPAVTEPPPGMAVAGVPGSGKSNVLPVPEPPPVPLRVLRCMQAFGAFDQWLRRVTRPWIVVPIPISGTPRRACWWLTTMINLLVPVALGAGVALGVKLVTGWPATEWQGWVQVAVAAIIIGKIIGAEVRPAASNGEGTR